MAGGNDEVSTSLFSLENNDIDYDDDLEFFRLNCR